MSAKKILLCKNFGGVIMKTLFDAVEMKNLHLKNRLIRSATWEGIAEYDGSIDENT